MNHFKFRNRSLNNFVWVGVVEGALFPVSASSVSKNSRLTRQKAVRLFKTHPDRSFFFANVLKYLFSIENCRLRTTKF